jgi:DNA-binding HxlR family transcriptional regulator
MAEPPIPSADVRRLSSGRWLIPILAVISDDGGSRFGVLARRLGISRSVLSAQLAALENFGWIVRNPGHGHPLRPEYLLTLAGRPVAAWCGRVVAQRTRLRVERKELGRWSLPLLFELHGDRRRFTELERGLAPITPRALSLTLGQMLEVRLVDRSLEVHASPLYGLSGRGQDFADALL